MKARSLVGIALVVFILDIWTKSFVYSLHKNPSDLALPIIVFLNVLGIDFLITFTENRGAAWGLFSDWPNLLVVFRIGLVIGLIIYLCRQARQSMKLPLVCIITGAIANIIDYFTYGFVVDMFSFTFWGYEYPVFNVADASICIGACLLLFSCHTRSEGKEA